jgi:hypothetical protein
MTKIKQMNSEAKQHKLYHIAYHVHVSSLLKCLDDITLPTAANTANTFSGFYRFNCHATTTLH